VPKVRSKDRGLKSLRQRLKKTAETTILVGIQDSEAADAHGGATVGEVAKFIQFGTVNQPARNFMDLAVRNIKQNLAEQIRRSSRSVVSPRASDPSSSTESLGEAAAAAVRDAIIELGAVDTGKLRDSVTYTLRGPSGRIIKKGKPR